MKAPTLQCFTRTTLALAIAAAGATSVVAQEQESLMLEEVIVTAQKREQSLMEVPVAVSAISGEQMHDLLSAAENIRAINGRVPSLVRSLLPFLVRLPIARRQATGLAEAFLHGVTEVRLAV